MKVSPAAYAAARNGDQRARDQVIAANMGLVYAIAKQWNRFAVPEYEDLVQIGVLGMMRAIETYDPSLSSFWTYAGRCVHSLMRRECFVQRRAVTIDLRSAKAVVREVGRAPTHSDLIRAALQQPVRLDAPGANPSGDPFGPMVESLPGDPGDAINELAQRRRDRSVKDAIAALPERERCVIRRRMREETLADTGRSWGVSSERVRQIEARALKRLRRRLRWNPEAAA